MDLKGIMLSEISDRDGTSLVVQWLRLCSSTSGGLGSIPGQGTKIWHATWRGQKKKKKEEDKCYHIRVHAYVHASLQSCLTLCDSMDCSPSGSSVHEIL